MSISSSYSQEFKKHIVFLSTDDLHGRAPGSLDEQKAADYIYSEFSKAKNAKVFIQKFPFSKDSAINVIGKLDYSKDSTIIISAHYDHLGMGSEKSREIGKKGIHPGADDNASGVAMMIELASWISHRNMIKYNFVFVAYSAHEAGLFGSDFFSKSEFSKKLKIKTVLNFDMVGRLDQNASILRVSGAQATSPFQSFFSKPMNGLNFRFDDTNIPLSDLKLFAEMKIPVLNFTTGTHDDYHKMSDTENKINYSGMENIFKTIQAFIEIYC